MDTSSSKFSPIRGGGFVSSMESDDCLILVYRVLVFAKFALNFLIGDERLFWNFVQNGEKSVPRFVAFGFSQ